MVIADTLRYLKGLNRQIDRINRVLCGCVGETVTITAIQETVCENITNTLGTTSLDSWCSAQWEILVADVWEAIPGETGRILSLGGLSPGTYTYRLTVTRPLCTLSSNEISITVDNCP